MRHRLWLPVFFALSIISLQARDCSLEGKLTAKDIAKDMPESPKEEKLQECAARGTYFEKKVRSCDTGTFEKGCKAQIEELEGEEK